MSHRTLITVVVASILLLTTFSLASSQSTTNAQIVFASNFEGGYRLYAMNADGTNFHFLPIPSGQLYVRDVIDATCSPDGRYILFEGSGLWRVDVDGSNLTNITLAVSTFSPVWSPVGDKIAFAGANFSSDDRSGEIYAINADGSNLVQVTQNNYPDSDPSWSPDGTKIAFAYDDNGTRGIAVVNADGTNLVRLTQSANYDTFPSWSPDGTEIAFSRKSGSLYDIYTIQPNGSNLTQLTASSGNNTRPKWSPDDSQISFSSDRDGGENEIYLMNSDGSNEHRVRIDQYDANDLNLCWLVSTTPENGPIVYVSKRSGNWDVYKINPDGSDDTSLTSSYTGQDWSPAWSPDGTHIAFKSLRDHSSGELYTMNADGSNVLRLTNNTIFDTDPDYSPDGTKILFSSARNGSDDELWTMNPDGTGQTLLYDSSGDDNQPVWSPDGSQIAFASNQSGNWEVWVMPSTGGTATNLTNHASLDNKPAWSADGGQIAFISDRTGYDVYVMPATGGAPTNLSNHTAYDSYPAYSPDGALMAFTSNRDGDQEVWTMTVTGTTPVQLTFNTALEWDPDWVALTAGNQALLSAPVVVGEAIPDNAPKPEKLNVLPAGTSEATHTDLFYVGAWIDEMVAGASVRTTHSIGGEVWFSFEGTEVILHVVTRPDALPIEVCIDEVCQTIDLYSAQPGLGSFTLGNLTAGAHTVHIINDSAGYLSLDAVEVPQK